MVRVVVPPGKTLDGWAFVPIAAIDPATKFTVTVGAITPLALAEMVAEPVLRGDVRLTCATPVLSVTAEAADKMPALVVKFTVTPAATAPVVSVTLARTAVMTPPAGTDAPPVVSVMELTSMAAALDVMLTEPTLALLVVAEMVSVPAVVPAV